MDPDSVCQCPGPGLVDPRVSRGVDCIIAQGRRRLSTIATQLIKYPGGTTADLDPVYQGTGANVNWRRACFSCFRSLQFVTNEMPWPVS